MPFTPEKTTNDTGSGKKAALSGKSTQKNGSTSAI